MFKFITDNLGTIIISIILLLIVSLIIFNIFNNKRKGKTSCGCGCSECPSSSSCHSKN